MFQTERKPAVSLGKVRSSFVLPLVVFIVIAAVAVTYATAWFKNQTLTTEVEAETAYLSLPENAEANEKNAELIAQVSYYNVYNTTVEQVDTILSSSSEFNREIFEAIDSKRPDGVWLTGITVQERVVSVQCATVSDTPPAEFAQALDQMDIFESVQYDGFTQSGDRYTFTLSCTLPSPEGGTLE